MMKGMSRAIHLALWLMAGGAAAAAPAKTSPSLTVDGAPVGPSYVVHIAADVDLPDRTILRVRCWRLEGGRPVAGSETQLFSEAQGGRMDLSWNIRRSDFRPGQYQFEATLRNEQPEAVASALTPAQKALRLAGRLDAGSERLILSTALEICRTLTVSFREMGKAAPAQGKHAEAAAAGTIDRKAWVAWKASIEPPLAAAERALARKDLLLFLPSAPLLSPLLNDARTSMAECEAATGGTPRPSAVPSRFPEDAAITKALSRVRLDALDLLATTAEDLLRHFTVLHDNREFRVQPLKPEQQALVKRQSEQIATMWPALQALPWGDLLPEALQQEAESLTRDVKSLPSARLTGVTPEGGEKDRKAGGGGEAAAVLLPRIQETVGRIREAVAAERTKKTGS